MNQKKQQPFALLILDGLGYSPQTRYNAFAQAHMPFLKDWLQHYPHTLLNAAGTAVGLLPGMIGNSEVGHLTIGAGRIVPQAITRILADIQDGSFYQNKQLLHAIKEAIQNKTRIHILGLMSDAGVHSHIKQVTALLKLIAPHTHTVTIHAFLDGRDTPPQSASQYLEQLDHCWHNLTGINRAPISSIHGRFYAMDRDNNWNRTKESLQSMISTVKHQHYFANWQAALQSYYHDGITDEFIRPTRLENFHPIESGDILIFINTRADRARQLVQLCIEQLTVRIITFSLYKPAFNVEVLYPPLVINHTLGDQLEAYQKSMFSIAETEKYAHITYFFNGGQEVIRTNETRILIPSKSHQKTYAHNPAMSAPEITTAIVTSLHHTQTQFYLVNYANADMVGHSGDLQATITALELLDQQLYHLYRELVLKYHGTLLIISDHGNAEAMFDPAVHQPITAHTNNQVPCILVYNKALYIKHYKNTMQNKIKQLKGLADIAPFILHYLGIPIPPVMPGSWLQSTLKKRI